MNDTLGSVLVLLCLFQVKHMFADYFLQTPRMLAGRGAYLHLGRAQHAGVHAAGSAIALAIVGTALPLLALLLVAEWVLHFHIDWGKAQWSDRHGHAPDQAGFWRAAGADQALHQLTYAAMLWAWVALA
jgi:hypothetical protein